MKSRILVLLVCAVMFSGCTTLKTKAIEYGWYTAKAIMCDVHDVTCDCQTEVEPVELAEDSE